jgi:hypothetical protein
MTLYRVYCKFEPDHINLPAGRKGQWRVLRSIKLWFPARPVFKVMDQLGIISPKPYPKGSIIRPHKALREALKVARRPTPCPLHSTGAGPCYCPGSIYEPLPMKGLIA